jgi:lipoprotein signal peptidase
MTCPSSFERNECPFRVNWAVQSHFKAALLLAAIVCAGAAWGLIHYSGQWFYLLLVVLAFAGTFAGIFADNQRLRTPNQPSRPA